MKISVDELSVHCGHRSDGGILGGPQLSSISRIVCGEGTIGPRLKDSPIAHDGCLIVDAASAGRRPEHFSGAGIKGVESPSERCHIEKVGEGRGRSSEIGDYGRGPHNLPVRGIECSKSAVDITGKDQAICVGG